MELGQEGLEGSGDRLERCERLLDLALFEGVLLRRPQTGELDGPGDRQFFCITTIPLTANLGKIAPE